MVNRLQGEVGRGSAHNRDYCLVWARGGVPYRGRDGSARKGLDPRYSLRMK